MPLPHLPKIRGVIRRRLLVNFRVDPEVMARHLPPPFRPKLHRGHAIAGICLIRLEGLRTPLVPLPLGLSSENAAHRVAVLRDDEEAVYVPRRDSDSWIHHVVGGRLLPGIHHRARFEVEDDGCRIDLRMTSADGQVRVAVMGGPAPTLPRESVFASVAEASRFFETGSLGYSATRDPERFDALILDTESWSVEPLAVTRVESSWFEDRSRFPAGSVSFDHALVMRDLRHEWRTAPELRAESRRLSQACG